MRLPQEVPVARAILSTGSVETRGRDAARNFKAIGALMMICGVPGCIAAGETNSNVLMGLGFLFFGVGITLFILGRFKE
jgi:hypothetical protein